MERINLIIAGLTARVNFVTYTRNLGTKLMRLAAMYTAKAAPSTIT